MEGMEKVYDTKASLDLALRNWTQGNQDLMSMTPSALASAGGGVVAYLHCCWNL